MTQSERPTIQGYEFAQNGSIESGSELISLLDDHLRDAVSGDPKAAAHLVWWLYGHVCGLYERLEDTPASDAAIQEDDNGAESDDRYVHVDLVNPDPSTDTPSDYYWLDVGETRVKVTPCPDCDWFELEWGDGCKTEVTGGFLEDVVGLLGGRDLHTELSGDPGYRLTGVPNDPPEFARSMSEQPPSEDDDRVVVWAPCEAEYGDAPTWYNYGPVQACRIKADGARWLPAGHCRLDEEPPEATPKTGDRVVYCAGDGHDRYVTNWPDDVDGWGDAVPEDVEAWDYYDEKGKGGGSKPGPGNGDEPVPRPIHGSAHSLPRSVIERLSPAYTQSRCGADRIPELCDLPLDAPQCARHPVDRPPAPGKTIVVWADWRQSDPLAPNGPTHGSVEELDNGDLWFHSHRGLGGAWPSCDTVKGLPITGWLPIRQCRVAGRPPDGTPKGPVAVVATSGETHRGLPGPHWEGLTACYDRIDPDNLPNPLDVEQPKLLPDEPPAFARQMTQTAPIDGADIVLWMPADDRPGADQWVHMRVQCWSPRLSPYADDSQWRWLPAEQCEVGGHLPEEVPAFGQDARCYFQRAGAVDVSWDYLALGEYCTDRLLCWDYPGHGR